MSFSAWRAYLEVCRLGSFSAAAQQLGYTQSAVSRQIAGLEREVGVRLLERRLHGTTPTPAGSAFLAHAQAAVHEADRAVAAARRDPPAAPPLRIGATPSLAAGLVPAAVRRLIAAHGSFPWTLVHGLSAELAQRMLGGDLDIAVVTDAPPGAPDHPAVEKWAIGTDEMVVVLPADHRLSVRSSIALAELVDDVWVEDNNGSAALLRQQAARSGFVPRLELVAADLAGKVAIVAAGHAVALIPGVLIPALRPDVVAVALEEPPTRGVYLMSMKNVTETTSDELVGALIAVWADIRSTV